MTLKTMHTAIDAWVYQALPSQNTPTSQFLRLNAASGNVRYSYIWFFMDALPQGAVVSSATLSLFLRRAWPSANTVTAKRILQTWAEPKVQWTNKPSVTTDGESSAVITDGLEGDEFVLDVTEMAQAWVGGANYGLRLEVDTSVATGLDFYSTEGAAAYRPSLILTYDMPPDEPTGLHPSGTRAVSTASPLLTWSSVTSSQTQVQVNTSDDFTTPLYDSGLVANVAQQWNLAGLLTLSNNTTYFWRVRIADANGNLSSWSDKAEFQYRTLGSLSITVPAGSTVTTPTPTITHTLTGRTQEFMSYLLYEDGTLIYERVKTPSAVTSFIIPSGYVRSTTATYTLVARAWDTLDRESLGGAQDYVQASKVFTLVTSVAVDPPELITGPPAIPLAVEENGHVLVTWKYTGAAPDFFVLKVEGVIVQDDIVPADVFVSGTTYQMRFYHALPRTISTYEVMALDGGILSADNPTADAFFDPQGIILLSESHELEVLIAGTDPIHTTIGETAGVFSLMSRRDPVRIVDSIRGLEGSLTGKLLTWSGQTVTASKDAFTFIKGHPEGVYRLLYGYRNIPVLLGEAELSLDPDLEETYTVGFSFAQTDEFEIDDV